MPDPDTEQRVTAADAMYVLEAFDKAGVEVWVAGGWGVDALVGWDTRPHRDLDVIVPMHQVLRAVETLHQEGFKVGEDWFPVRFEMVDTRGRVVDIHPVRKQQDRPLASIDRLALGGIERHDGEHKKKGGA